MSMKSFLPVLQIVKTGIMERSGVMGGVKKWGENE